VAALTGVRSSLSVLAAVILLAGGCTADTPQAAGTPPAPVKAAKDCTAPVQNGPLPQWARAGFTGDAVMPHTLGDRGEIVAAIFGNPLTVSRSDGTSNKILWVSKTPAPTGDLVIEARLDGTGTAETRRVAGGPGPSIIDLPRSGCWLLTLTWPEHTDTMALAYK
jgi:hypothetical protein